MEEIDENYFKQSLLWKVLYNPSSSLTDSYNNPNVSALKIILNQNKRTPRAIMTYLKGEKDIDFKLYIQPSNETEADEVMKKDWKENAFVVPFVNKKFSMESWLKTAIISSLKFDKTIVVLFPSRTNAAWFHDFVFKDSKHIWIQGKLIFDGFTTQSINASGLALFSRSTISEQTKKDLNQTFGLCEEVEKENNEGIK